MKKILLTQNKTIVIDDEDYPLVSLFKWRLDKDGYVVCGLRINNKHITLRLHRLIGNAKPREEVDHIDHNTLNNQKLNLRICTHSQNHMNKRKYKGTSQYKGVSWYQHAKKWGAYIRLNNKTIHLGIHENEKEAAIKYNQMAKELFGNFAHLNKI